MQESLPAFEAAGVSLFVIFPEPVEQLASFADEFDITLPVLADPDSEIIRDFGILNTTVPEDEPYFGIPYPGSYVVGAEGNVAAKFFEQNALVRVRPDTLLRAALGEDVETEPAADVSATPLGSPETVEAEVLLEGDELPAFLMTDLVVKLRVPAGQHLYGPPVSEGLVTTSVTLDESFHVGSQPPQFPPTTPMVLEGTGETLHVYDGDVEIRIPVVFTGVPPEPNEDGVRMVEISGTIRWQSCDDQACHIPRTEPFSLSVPVGRVNVPQWMRDMVPESED